MSTLFFGDSLTEGTNCEHKYTDFLPGGWGVRNYAISGTTIGEYSIYPVDGQGLLSQIKEYDRQIADADTIFIEYGTNDVSAIMCGFATEQKVLISLVKAIDWIKQLNPDVEIIFLIPGSKKVVAYISHNMCEYLKNVYFKQFELNLPETIYSDTFNRVITGIQKVCRTMYMYDDNMLTDAFLSDDNIHPNSEGHLRIARNIIEQYHF